MASRCTACGRESSLWLCSRALEPLPAVRRCTSRLCDLCRDAHERLHELAGPQAQTWGIYAVVGTLVVQQESRNTLRIGCTVLPLRLWYDVGVDRIAARHRQTLSIVERDLLAAIVERLARIESLARRLCPPS